MTGFIHPASFNTTYFLIFFTYLFAVSNFFYKLVSPNDSSYLSKLYQIMHKNGFTAGN